MFDTLDLRRQPREHPRRARRPALPLRARRHLRPGRRARQPMDGHDAVVHFAAETHVDRSIKDGYSFVRTNCFGTNVLCDVARQRRGRALPAHLHRRGLRLDRATARSRETDPLVAALAVLGGEGRQRPDRAQLPHHPRPAGAGDAVRQQLRAVPVPREGDPAVHHQPARRQAACRSTATAATCATGSTSHDHNTRRRPRAASAARRRDLQHRRRQRDHQPRAHLPPARADRPRRELHRPRRGPARPRPPLLDHARQGQRARLEAPSTTWRRAGRTRSSGTATTAPGGSR